MDSAQIPWTGSRQVKGDSAMVLPDGLLKFRSAFRSEGVISKKLISKKYRYINYKTNDKNHFLFGREYNSDLDVSILFSFQQENICNAAIMLGSRSVKNFYSTSVLPWQGIPLEIDRPVTIVAVDLVWLRLNCNPADAAIYKNDYDYSCNAGIERIFFDLESVGEEFIGKFKNKISQAQMLMNLDNYIRNVDWGGDPKSVSPYIYSAILFIVAGDLESARIALDKGLITYATEVPRPVWEDVRLTEFQLQRSILLKHVEQQEKNDA